jgi:ABC-type antimicrobial peptide transport system permease subunit
MGINRIVASAMSDELMNGNISVIPWWLAVTAVIFSTVMGMVAGYFPARRAMKLSPLAAIRTE